MIDLSIVIVSYETAELLAKCLGSVERACLEDPGLHVETIVVENGSRDGSAEIARSAACLPRVISLVRNRGFAVAVNYGLRARRGRHVLLLNSDVEIDAELLIRGVKLLDEATDVGILGAALVHPDGRPQRSVHSLPNLQSEWVPEPILRWLRPHGFMRSIALPEAAEADPLPVEVEAVRGAVFFIRGELLEEIGLLDEGYFFFLEETDYCWRVREAGNRVLHCDSLKAMHHLGASSKARMPLATRIEFHRSLYRYFERRSGYAVSTAVRLSRMGRTGLALIAVLPFLIASRSLRRRFAERWGLLLWHLRGRPLTGGLVGEPGRAVRESPLRE